MFEFYGNNRISWFSICLVTSNSDRDPLKVHPIKRTGITPIAEKRPVVAEKRPASDENFKAPKKKVSRSSLLQLCSETKSQAEKELAPRKRSVSPEIEVPVKVRLELPPFVDKINFGRNK